MCYQTQIQFIFVIFLSNILQYFRTYQTKSTRMQQITKYHQFLKSSVTCFAKKKLFTSTTLNNFGKKYQKHVFCSWSWNFRQNFLIFKKKDWKGCWMVQMQTTFFTNFFKVHYQVYENASTLIVFEGQKLKILIKNWKLCKFLCRIERNLNFISLIFIMKFIYNVERFIRFFIGQTN